jgi:hypothetical protein
MLMMDLQLAPGPGLANGNRQSWSGRQDEALQAITRQGRRQPGLKPVDIIIHQKSQGMLDFLGLCAGGVSGQDHQFLQIQIQDLAGAVANGDQATNESELFQVFC